MVIGETRAGHPATIQKKPLIIHGHLLTSEVLTDSVHSRHAFLASRVGVCIYYFFNFASKISLLLNMPLFNTCVYSFTFFQGKRHLRVYSFTFIQGKRHLRVYSFTFIQGKRHLRVSVY